MLKIESLAQFPVKIESGKKREIVDSQPGRSQECSKCIGNLKLPLKYFEKSVGQSQGLHFNHTLAGDTILGGN